jgi:hypothetical protein
VQLKDKKRLNKVKKLWRWWAKFYRKNEYKLRAYYSKYLVPELEDATLNEPFPFYIMNYEKVLEKVAKKFYYPKIIADKKNSKISKGFRRM